eukprot:2610115-Pleurochrysis_carterae.AAC.2
MARHAAADKRWSFATAMNIRWMESVRAHERRVASCNEEQASAGARRTLRPCDGKRTHRLINFPNGTSMRP